MTMPHLTNCEHSESGWCLKCVNQAWSENKFLRGVLLEIQQIGHNPADLASDLIGLDDRYEKLATRLADLAHDALRRVNV